MKGTIKKKTEGAHIIQFSLYIEIYKSAHYTLFMYASDYTDPRFTIVNTETREDPEITGVKWDDLKDVMNALEILEEEYSRDIIGE